MALLINKPKRVVINTSVALTINRPELASMFASDAYWSDTSNWKTVYFYYRDPTGVQNITVMFPSGVSQAQFKTSGKVKQAGWLLDKVVIQDYDRGLKSLYRKKSLAKLQECDFVVAVANRTPSKIFLSNTSPNENQTFVGNLTATDPDILDPLTYSVVSGFGDAASFQVVGTNALHFVTAPNFEVKNQYSVKIRVTDSSDAYYDEVFTINIIDVNDAPSNITLSNNTINENSSINTVIGTFTVTDEDVGDSFTFALSGTDAASFNLSGNQLRSSAVFDYETKASYSITVTATDRAGATVSNNFNISVLNINEAPAGITLSNSSINEQSAVNSVVGALTTTDPDGDTVFTYSIVGGDTSAFNIDGNQLRASQVFDFETKSSYSVTVRSTDSGGLTFDKTFTINVTNINEAPTDISLSNASIGEYNAINAVIGTLSATAPTGQSISYSLVGGDVASFNINGTQLRASVSYVYTSKSSYSITIRATSGGEYFDKNFTISIIDYTYTYTGKIISATTGSGVSGASVNFYSSSGGTLLASATTNSTGNYTVNLEASGSYYVTVSASGYQTWNGTLNTATTVNIAISTALGGNVARAVLEWGASPADLDFYLVGPTSSGSRFEVFYSNKTVSGEASLDIDDTNGYGPETITINRFNAGTYTFFVNRYSTSGNALKDSGAKITLFLANGSQFTFTVPYADGTYWTAFSINGSTQSITTINSMSSTKPSPSI